MDCPTIQSPSHGGFLEVSSVIASSLNICVPNAGKNMNTCIDCGAEMPERTVRANICAFCLRKRQKEYQRIYNQKPEIKLKQKEYLQRPEVKERMKKYYQRPSVKARQAEYQKRPYVKERKKEYLREYQQRPYVKARLREYYRRPEVKKRRREYLKRRQQNAKMSSVQQH
jgi:hypothetical protein